VTPRTNRQGRDIHIIRCKKGAINRAVETSGILAYLVDCRGGGVEGKLNMTMSLGEGSASRVLLGRRGTRNYRGNLRIP